MANIEKEWHDHLGAETYVMLRAALEALLADDGPYR